MFKSLTNNLTKIFDKIRSTGTLSQAQIDESMRDIRIALLEADVSLPVIKEFIDNIKSIIRCYSQKLDKMNLRFSDFLANLLKHKITLLQQFSGSLLSIHKTLQYQIPAIIYINKKLACLRRMITA
jgi:signal recognition particle GTPase